MIKIQSSETLDQGKGFREGLNKGQILLIYGSFLLVELSFARNLHQ